MEGLMLIDELFQIYERLLKHSAGSPGDYEEKPFRRGCMDVLLQQ